MCFHNRKIGTSLARNPPLCSSVPRVAGTMSDTACGIASFGFSMLWLPSIVGKSLVGSRMSRTKRQYLSCRITADRRRLGAYLEDNEEV